MSTTMELKEKIVHGNELFPIAVYSYDNGYTRHILDCHWHDEMEFIYLTQGKAVFQIETTKLEVTAGQAVFVNSGLLHTGESLDLSHCIYYAVVFNPSMLLSSNYDICQSEYIDPMINRLFFLPQIITGNSGWEKEILVQLSDIINYFFQKPYGYELGIKACLFKIISEIIINQQHELFSDKFSVRNNFKSERIKAVLKYIYSNYNSVLRVDTLAKIANMNTDYFCKFFKSLTGKTPVDYINSYRINQACRLLINKDNSISDIASEVGFENISYFIKKFKGSKGYTPAKFRQMINKASGN